MVVLWDISTGKFGPAQVLCEFQLLERGWREGGERVGVSCATQQESYRRIYVSFSPTAIRPLLFA